MIPKDPISALIGLFDRYYSYSVWIYSGVAAGLCYVLYIFFFK